MLLAEESDNFPKTWTIHRLFYTFHSGRYSRLHGWLISKTFFPIKLIYLQVKLWLIFVISEYWCETWLKQLKDNSKLTMIVPCSCINAISLWWGYPDSRNRFHFSILKKKGTQEPYKLERSASLSTTPNLFWWIILNLWHSYNINITIEEYFRAWFFEASLYSKLTMLTSHAKSASLKKDLYIQFVGDLVRQISGAVKANTFTYVLSELMNWNG